MGGGFSSFLHGENGDGFAAGLGNVGERDVVGAWDGCFHDLAAVGVYFED